MRDSPPSIFSAAEGVVHGSRQAFAMRADESTGADHASQVVQRTPSSSGAEKPLQPTELSQKEKRSTKRQQGQHRKIPMMRPASPQKAEHSCQSVAGRRRSEP